MVILNLEEILKREEIFEREYVFKPEDISIPADVGDLIQPVRVKVRIDKDDRGYRVKLSLTGEVQLECSRCLELFSKSVIQDTVKHIQTYPSEEVINLSEEDLDVSFAEDIHEVVLEDLVREEILLSIPMKPLCKPDCPGINHGALILEDNHSDPDPRFAILKNLLTK